jgi:hypothetical protein
VEPFSMSFILGAYPYKSFSLKGKFCGAVVIKKVSYENETQEYLL